MAVSNHILTLRLLGFTLCLAEFVSIASTEQDRKRIQFYPNYPIGSAAAGQLVERGGYAVGPAPVAVAKVPTPQIAPSSNVFAQPYPTPVTLGSRPPPPAVRQVGYSSPVFAQPYPATLSYLAPGSHPPAAAVLQVGPSRPMIAQPYPAPLVRGSHPPPTAVSPPLAPSEGVVYPSAPVPIRSHPVNHIIGPVPSVVPLPPPPAIVAPRPQPHPVNHIIGPVPSVVPLPPPPAILAPRPQPLVPVPPATAIVTRTKTIRIGMCPGGPSLGIPCDAKRPWPACPPQSYCYASNSVDIGPYYCCPVWSTYGAKWRPQGPFYPYYPPMPYNWPAIIKATAGWPSQVVPGAAYTGLALPWSKAKPLLNRVRVLKVGLHKMSPDRWSMNDVACVQHSAGLLDQNFTYK